MKWIKVPKREKVEQKRSERKRNKISRLMQQNVLNEQIYSK